MKVGDKVRILDGSRIDGYKNGWCREMNTYVGDIEREEK